MNKETKNKANNGEARPVESLVIPQLEKLKLHVMKFGKTGSINGDYIGDKRLFMDSTLPKNKNIDDFYLAIENKNGDLLRKTEIRSFGTITEKNVEEKLEEAANELCDDLFAV